ncbi:hypothetical protein CCZ01_04345 [Helicobacter monodelphidis]|uniref:hypothetical protein n=1 Tax=Helicobacter sp. 15-1451 TaxID=2004995 RepID=UPI000DCB408E|nr:hypothetical protein [Helicobacter sp. 15-1451]RAX58042.1 hypothetical protein CCZ01_04345 [Helicobacter sp. 15-1451]
MLVKGYVDLYEKECKNDNAMDRGIFQSREVYLQEQCKHYKEYSLLGTPEEKVRIFLSAFDSPYLLGLYEAFSADDLELLNNVLYQLARTNLFDMGQNTGADHSMHYILAFRLLSGNCISFFEKIYPKSLGLCQNGMTMGIVTSNLLMALYYQDSAMLDDAKQEAKYFLDSNQLKFDKAIVECLLAFCEEDWQKINESLQKVAVLKVRQNIAPLSKRFSSEAHALFAFGHYLFPEEAKKQLKIPNAKGFVTSLAKWNVENQFPQGQLFLHYDGVLQGMNQLLEIDIPPCRLTKNFLNQTVVDAAYFQKEVKERALRIFDDEESYA